MKRILFLASIAGLACVASAAVPAKQPTPDELLRLLQSRGLLARPYYNGVPDPSGRQYGQRVKLTRQDMRKKLSDIILPSVNDQRQLDGVGMDVAVDYIQKLIRSAGGEMNVSINQFLVAGGVGAASAPAAGGGNAGGGAAAPPAIGGAGQPAVGVDGLPVGGGGLPGVPGGIPGLPGMPGGAVGGAPAGGSTGAFDPRSVRLVGFTTPINNISALELLDRVAVAFDHPNGIQYNLEPDLGGIIFTERSKNNIDPKTGAPLFTRILYVNPNLFSQGLTTPPPSPGGITGGGNGMNGGGMNGGGMNGGGMMGGGMPGGGMMGGGMNGMGGMGGMPGGGMMGGGFPGGGMMGGGFPGGGMMGGGFPGGGMNGGGFPGGGMMGGGFPGGGMGMPRFQYAPQRQIQKSVNPPMFNR